MCLAPFVTLLENYGLMIFCLEDFVMQLRTNYILVIPSLLSWGIFSILCNIIP